MGLLTGFGIRIFVFLQEYVTSANKEVKLYGQSVEYDFVTTTTISNNSNNKNSNIISISNNSNNKNFSPSIALIPRCWTLKV